MAALGRRYAAVLDRYAYVNERGERVLCWDHARWLNHSCRANVLSTGWDFDIAVEDIACGEQITNDYGCLNLDRSFRCLCEQPGCRGRIRPDDWNRLTPVWDARIAEVFPAAGSVEQPLWPWVREPRAVRAAMREPSRLPSIGAHRFVGPSVREPARRGPRPARAVSA